MSLEINNINLNNGKPPNNTSIYNGNQKLCEKNNNRLTDYNREKNKNEEKTSKNKEKSTKLSKLLTFFVAAVAGTAICVTGTESILPTTEKAKIECFSILDTSVYYFVEFEDFDEHQENAKVVLTNDFTNREQEIKFSSYEGYFEDLKPNMYYTIRVLKNSSIVAEKKFKTLSTKEYKKKYEKFNIKEFQEKLEYTEPEFNEPNTNQEPIIEDPTLSDPTTPDTISDDPTYDDPIYDEPTSDDPTYDPTYGYPTSDPTNDDPTSNKPINNDQTANTNG